MSSIRHSQLVIRILGQHWFFFQINIKMSPSSWCSMLCRYGDHILPHVFFSLLPSACLLNLLSFVSVCLRSILFVSFTDEVTIGAKCFMFLKRVSPLLLSVSWWLLLFLCYIYHPSLLLFLGFPFLSCYHMAPKNCLSPIFVTDYVVCNFKDNLFRSFFFLSMPCWAYISRTINLFLLEYSVFILTLSRPHINTSG